MYSSNIEISINLDRYNTEQIINLYKQGVISIKEIKNSGRIRTLFSDDLAKFVHDQEKKVKASMINREEKTAII